MDFTVKIAEPTWSKLQILSQSASKSTDDIVEEALQAYLNKSETGSIPNGQAIKRAQATYKPQTHLRQISVVPSEAAVLFIDVQNYNCHKDGAEMLGLPPVDTSHNNIATCPSVACALQFVLLVVLAPDEGPLHTYSLGVGSKSEHKALSLCHHTLGMSTLHCTGYRRGLLVEEAGGD